MSSPSCRRSSGGALEAALLLGEAESDADDRAVAAAFLAALRVLAGERPVCLAVDDVQGWTRRRCGLGYALARLDVSRSPHSGSPRRSSRLASPRPAREPTPDGALVTA